MPPAISDDEMSDGGDGKALVRTNAKRDTKTTTVEYDEEEHVPVIKGDVPDGDGGDNLEDEEEDDEDLEPDEFVVESIVGHVVQNGIIKYKVKWEGYEKKSDQTWEEEDNLKENATVVLDEYLEKVGGRDAILKESKAAVTGKKRARPASNTPNNGTKRTKRTGSHPASTTPPASVSEKKWKAPAGSWEDEVESIDACHDEQSGKLVVYLTWKNGQKTQHDTKVVYTRCPQKMLQFYERHVKIVKTTIDADE